MFLPSFVMEVEGEENEVGQGRRELDDNTNNQEVWTCIAKVRLGGLSTAIRCAI